MPVPDVTDVSAPVGPVRAAAVEPGRLVSVKPEVQVGPAQLNHDPRAQRPYTEELRREPITDRCVHGGCFSCIISHTSQSTLLYVYVYMYMYLLILQRSVCLYVASHWACVWFLA